jgi:hypothetical protein
MGGFARIRLLSALVLRFGWKEGQASKITLERLVLILVMSLLLACHLGKAAWAMYS